MDLSPFSPSGRRGYTLLELILALGLTAVVLLIVTTGITVQLRAFDMGRSQVEQAQLARVLLHYIADDLRGAIAPGSSSGSGSPGVAAADDLGMTDEASSDDLLDLGDASSTGGGSPAGIYGELDWLRVDVVRAVRQETASADGLLGDTSARSMRQIETIVYYVVSPEESTAAAGIGDETEEPRGGLVRRELIRPMAALADQQGTLDYLDLSIAPLASGAATVSSVEFRYHDGTDWVEEWDSSASGALPSAVEIRLFLQAAAPDPGLGPVSTSQAATDDDEGLTTEYRLVVAVPQAGQASSGSAGATDMASSDETGATSDGSQEGER